MGIADELITRGWYQGAGEGLDGSVCLAVAVNKCMPGLYATVRGIKVVAQCIGVERQPDVIEWNDAPDRTYDEVLRVAKQADELLDAQRLNGEI